MKRERSYRTEAIIIRRSDFGEADRLLTLLTRDYGKLRAIAKGARKPQSRKTGHVELFMRSQFMLAKGRNLDIVTQVELIEPHRVLSADLVRATYAAYVVELLDSFTPEEERQVAIYELLRDTLGRLDTSDNVRLVARYFELRLLSLVGYQPQLFYCVVSGEPIEQADQYISPEEGGLIAAAHLSPAIRARQVSAGAVKVLRFLQTRAWDTVAHLQLRDDLHRELEMVMHYYIQYLLEKGVKSAEFLYRLRRETISLTQNQPLSNDSPNML